MIFLWCLIYVLILLVCGSAVVIVILGPERRSALELLSLAITLGAGITSILLIWLSILGLKPSRISIVLLGLAAACCGALSGAIRGWPSVARPGLRRPVWSDLAMLLPAGAIAAAVLLVAMFALRYDMFEGDTLLIWGFRARVLFHEALQPKPLTFTDPLYSYTHQDYPLLISMLIAAAYAMVGELNEKAGKTALPLLFASQAMLGFVTVRRWLSPLRALCVTALLTCIPFSVMLSGTGNADPVLETFYLGSLVYLVRWIEQSRRPDLVLSSVFCTLGAMTKQEGLPLALIQLVVVLGFILLRRNQRRAWEDFGLSFAILVVGAGTWWVWRMGLPHTVDNYDARFRVSIFLANFARVFKVIPRLAHEALSFTEWGALWLLLPVSAAIGFRAFAKSPVLVLWVLMILHLGLYLATYIVTKWDVDKLLDVSRVRLMLHVAPAAMLLIALHWSAFRPAPSPTE